MDLDIALQVHVTTRRICGNMHIALAETCDACLLKHEFGIEENRIYEEEG